MAICDFLEIFSIFGRCIEKMYGSVPKAAHTNKCYTRSWTGVLLILPTLNIRSIDEVRILRKWDTTVRLVCFWYISPRAEREIPHLLVDAKKQCPT
jgi:hypothetical protein